MSVKSGRARTRPVEGDYVEYDPLDWQPFADFCGPQWLGTEDDGQGVVRGRGPLRADGTRAPGAVARVQAGARAVRLDGGGGVTVVAPENFEGDGSWEDA